MAEQEKTPKEVFTFKFKTVELFKEQSLGVGSFGAVCKAKCDDLICAAKILHPTLICQSQISPQREHRLPLHRFQQECEFMSGIRHPNIVQYLGSYRDSADTCLPVLLMELMDESLTHFLQSSEQPVPYHTTVCICSDICQALSFLHSNNIIHRDLSSNNVLLLGNVLAKVSDFGMARLGDINLQATFFTSTMCPGTEVYMPPEAVQDKTEYSEKLDCFSFGVITLQILTQLFPKPGNRLNEVELSLPEFATTRTKLLMQVPEAKRRQNHIRMVDSAHPLLPVIFDCLKDHNERPSAHQLCERLSQLKATDKYLDSARADRNKEVIIQSLASQLEEKNHTLSSMEQEMRILQLELEEREETIQKKDGELEEREKQLGQVSQQLQQKDKELHRMSIEIHRQRQLEGVENLLQEAHDQKEAAQIEIKVTEHEQLLCQRDQQQNQRVDTGQYLPNFTLKWRGEREMSHDLVRCFDAVVDGNTVYLRNEGTVKIYSYDVVTDSWCRLPDCVIEGGSITVINGLLTSVGGYISNGLLSLTGKGNDRTWTKSFPPMPTMRCDTTALCVGTALIVAGGEGEDGALLSTVEVMNTESHQWSTAAQLPQPMYWASAAVCSDCVYMLGGLDKYMTTHSKSVYTCSVSALLQSCVSSSQETKQEMAKNVSGTMIWREVAPLPAKRSTCVSLHGQLLAVGGKDDSNTAIKMVYRYDSSTNSWEIVGHMATSRYNSFAAVLPNNQLIVFGGLTGYGRPTRTLELANVVV